ncbi:MAG: ATP-binding protein [Treponema sp.]|nr:ATP-binding protein [Treponema sp.]
MNIPKRVGAAILNSLAAGVVPRIGLEFLAVGRKREFEAALRDLMNLQAGAASFRFVTGRYGSGKSFFLQAIRNYALENDFVTADADLSPEKRLAGSHRGGLETYRELMQRLATKPRPEGGALEVILQKWINALKLEVLREGVQAGEEKFPSLVEWKIFETIAEMKNFAHGFDFAEVISTYFKAYLEGSDERREASLRWLRGEFASKTEARQYLHVGEIITDETWYEYLKLLAVFCTRIGYRGLLVFIDECINLYKIANRQARENNYEKLLAMFNDILQGKAQSLGIYMAGVPQFIEDERRGLFSYPALKSRLAESRFVRDGYADLGSPVIRLAQLSQEEIYVLLERLTEIHAGHFGYAPRLGERELTRFLELVLSAPGAAEFITPREIARDFLSLLNILNDDRDADFYSLINRQGYGSRSRGQEDGNPYAEFDL